MKISRILFIGFFALIGVVLILFAIPANEEYKKISEEKNERVDNVIEVPNFNHLIIENGCKVYLKNSETGSSYFSISEHADSVPSVPGFIMRGDTLVVTSTRRHSGNSMTLFSDSSESYLVKGYLNMQVDQEKIVASVEGGHLIIQNNVNTALQVIANNGKIEHYGKSITMVDAYLVKSKLRIHESYLDKATIKAESKSEIMLKRPAHLEMERDRSCKYYERD